jgi:hemolysin activation/secretion protein
VGSTVFSPEEFAKVTAPFTNRPLSFAELIQARSAVTQLYIDQGYVTSGAFIPPQTLQRGVVTIQVLEGRLEEINVTGTRRLRSSYVRDRIAKGAAKPLNVPRLLEALQLLQLNPLIENLSADLSTGSQPGTSLLEVQVREARSFRPQLILDNARSPSVGSFQRGIQLNEGNLLGFGDSASLAYINTDGSNELDASYTFPINPDNGTLSFSYDTTWSRVVEPPFSEVFDIRGDSRDYALTLRQPLVQTPTQEFALGLSVARRESDVSFAFLERDFLPPLEPDLQGRTRLVALRFFQEWTQQSTQAVFAARSQLSLGFGTFDPLFNETAPDSPFFAWRGQLQWGRLLAPETLLLLRSDVQLTPSSLFPIEQFGLGGQASVRGYRQDLFLTDNGAFASAELRFPIYRAPRQQAVLQIVPFIDVGAAWNYSGQDNPNPNTLASVGLGLRFQLDERLTARFDWGIPLVSVNSTERTWQEQGLYFSILYSPF